MISGKEETLKLMKVETKLWGVLNAMFLRSTHGARYLLLIAKQYSSLRTYNLFIHSSVNEHLGCFQVGVVMHENIITILAQVFLWTYVLIFLGSVSRSETAIQFSKVIIQL